MTILIVGNKGQLGWALEQQAAARGVDVFGVDLPELDLTDRDAVYQLVSREPYSAVVNAAAYTAVDKAESNIETAFAVNRDGVAHLAGACLENSIPLIHISTDYVFNGKSDVPYKPDDRTVPLGVYGRSKAEGENEVKRQLPLHIIIRTSWLYGAHGNNFVKTMLRLSKEKKELRVVEDQRGCPTFAGDLADAIIKIVEMIKYGQELKWGTYHYCNTGVTSWYDFAQKVIELATEHEKLAVEKIVPIPTSDYPTPAPRPAFSALDCSSFGAAFGVEMHPWEESLGRMISRLYDTAHC